MIWMRSRLAEAGSFTAHTTNVGAVPFPLDCMGDRSAPHGNSARVGLLHPVAGVHDVLVETPTAEEAHFDVRAADAKGLLAIHRVPEGGARVLLGPHTRQPAGVFQPHIH